MASSAADPAVAGAHPGPGAGGGPTLYTTVALLVATNAAVIFCSSHAARQAVVESSQSVASLALLALLAVVVLGLPVGFGYLAFRGILWLAACLADKFPWTESLYSYFVSL